MKNVSERYSAWQNWSTQFPLKSKRRGKLLCVAAYCRVSTAFEEQKGSLKAQPQFYTSMIDMRPDWINAGILSDRATGLNTAECPGYAENHTRAATFERRCVL